LQIATALEPGFGARRLVKPTNGHEVSEGW